MVAVLKLTDGINTIDFIPSNSDFRLYADGLEIGFPDVERITGGSSNEGDRLIERRYGNRIITINFKIVGSDHDDLVADVRVLDRLTNVAKKTAVEILGKKVELRYKFDLATDEVAFDVIDGEFLPGKIASLAAHRGNVLLECKLTLICEPYARSVSPIYISNYLLNPDFEWNPAEGGRDADYQLDFGAAGQSLTRVPAGLQSSGTPPIMSVCGWFNRDTFGILQTIALCGQTTKAWRLYFSGANNLNFEWVDSTGTRTVISQTAITAIGWHFFGVTMFTSDGTDVIAVLVIDEKIEGFVRIAAPTAMVTAAGNFIVGQAGADVELFNGKLAGLAIIVGQQILPNQLLYLYQYGIRGLYSATLGLQNPTYWGFEGVDYGAIWPFQSSDSSLFVSDQSANLRPLNINGSPPRTSIIRKPKGWTIGTDFNSSANAGLRPSSVKQGLLGLFLNDTGTATRYIEQIITPKEGELFWTIHFWAKGNAASQSVDLVLSDSGGSTTHTVALTNGVWKQFIVTRAVSGGLTIRIGRLTGSTNFDFDLPVVMHGEPYGTFASPTDTTAAPKPFIGSRFIRAFPDATKVSWVPLYDFPGDAPTTARIHFRNTSGQILGPIRIGASSGRNPWKQFMFWNLASWVPDFANSSGYGTFPDPPITSASAVTFIDRVKTALSRLFPFPVDQFGSFKVYIGVEGENNMLSTLKYETAVISLFLSGDPIKDTNVASVNVHMVDGGILSWPPEQAINEFRLNRYTSRPRVKADDLTPKLVIVNISDTVIAAPSVSYHSLILIPVEHGYYVLQPDSSLSNDSGLRNQEVLVVDTIEEEAINNGYILTEIDLPATGPKFNLHMLQAAGVSLYGTGFMFEPDQSALLVFQMNKLGTLSTDKIFGVFDKTMTAEVAIEFSSRYLYV